MQRRLLRPSNARHDRPKTKLLRAAVGGAAGGVLGLMSVLLGLDSSLGPAQRDRFIFEIVGGATVTGGLLAAIAGSRAIRGKIVSVLIGGSSGMLIGAVVAVILDLVLNRWRGSIREISIGLVIVGGIVGAIVGRTRHKDPATLVELMSGIALICAVLALFLRMP